MAAAAPLGPFLALDEGILRVSLHSPQRASRIECVAGCGGPLDGTANGARLMEPFGVAFDKQGNWYICEHAGQRITKVDQRKNISVFAGRENTSPEPEGSTAARLKFHDPHGLVVSKDQQMYIADTLNHRVVKIDLKTGQSSTVAGTGQAGYSGDGGPAGNATFNQLYALDLNQANDKLYITDLRNRRIRLLDLKTGTVTTIAGNGQEGIPSDGSLAITSPLVDPRATAIDSRGNVYILERGGNALRVLDKQGKIRTVIGTRSGNLNGPKDLRVDRNDDVIISDTENHLIKKCRAKDGSVVVIAGTGEKGDRLVADDPLKTQLNRPHGIFLHHSGALYISDSENHRVLRLSNP